MKHYDLEHLLAQANLHFADQRPLVAVTGNYEEGFLKLASDYYERLVAAGASVMILPPTADLDYLSAVLGRIDAVLLTGGADVNPLWNNEDPLPTLGAINPLRDKQELLLARLAEQRQIPILGICRGMQVLALAFGGEVYQDLTLHSPPKGKSLLQHSQKSPRSEAAHCVQAENGSTIAQLLGCEFVVNSLHHQAVKDCGPHFRATAISADGVIEAMESTAFKSILAVQWHPECQAVGEMHKLFEWLVDEARSYRRARQWHEHNLTLDSHCDTPMFFDQDINFNRREEKILVDICKMHEGGLDASIMVAYLAQQTRTPDAHNAATEKADSILSQLEKMVADCPQAAIATTPADLYRHKKAGKKSIMMGIENGYAFGEYLDNVARYRARGIVYTTLCHNGNNNICDSARPSSSDLLEHPSTAGKEHGGLSEFGSKVVQEMNRVGMMVDLSHADEATFYDALQLSAVPIVCSHSSARSLCNHPRNLTDQQLRDLAASGGVAQCTFYKGFLKDHDENTASILDAVAHIQHMVSVAGIDHVGIGTDFDGDGGVRGLANAAELINLTRRLMAIGYTDEDLRKLWGANFLRVMQQAQDYAASTAV